MTAYRSTRIRWAEPSEPMMCVAPSPILGTVWLSMCKQARAQRPTRRRPACTRAPMAADIGGRSMVGCDPVPRSAPSPIARCMSMIPARCRSHQVWQGGFDFGTLRAAIAAMTAVRTGYRSCDGSRYRDTSGVPLAYADGPSLPRDVSSIPGISVPRWPGNHSYTAARFTASLPCDLQHRGHTHDRSSAVRRHAVLPAVAQPSPTHPQATSVGMRCRFRRAGAGGGSTPRLPLPHRARMQRWPGTVRAVACWSSAAPTQRGAQR